MPRCHWFVGSVLALLLLPVGASAQILPEPLSRLLREAPVVVVGTAERAEPEWRQNQHGDRLIVTRMLVHVDETLKGSAPGAFWVDIEGGTLDGVTLRVSSAPDIRPGARGVYLLQQRGQTLELSERARGFLPLDRRNTVPGSTLALDDIRNATQQSGGAQ